MRTIFQWQVLCSKTGVGPLHRSNFCLKSSQWHILFLSEFKGNILSVSVTKPVWTRGLVIWEKIVKWQNLLVCVRNKENMTSRKGNLSSGGRASKRGPFGNKGAGLMPAAKRVSLEIAPLAKFIRNYMRDLNADIRYLNGISGTSMAYPGPQWHIRELQKPVKGFRQLPRNSEDVQEIFDSFNMA